MGSKPSKSIPSRLNSQNNSDDHPIDQLFKYAKENIILHINIVRELRLKHLADNQLNINTDYYLCNLASSQGLLNLIIVLVIHLQIKEFDAIVKGATESNQVTIINWLFNDLKSGAMPFLKSINIPEIKKQWLCIRWNHEYTYNENILEILLSNASISAIEEAYIITNAESGYLPINVFFITKYNRDWKKIDWKKMFKKMDILDEAIRILEDKCIVEHQLVPLQWAKEYVEQENCSACYQLIQYLKDH